MYTKKDVGDKIVDGEVVAISDTEKEAIANEWNANFKAAWPGKVSSERESRLNTAITVTLSDGDYQIPVTERSRVQALESSKRASNNGTPRPFPTTSATKSLGASDLTTIADALDSYVTGVWNRQIELEGLIADGTITQADIESGWPSTDQR